MSRRGKQTLSLPTQTPACSPPWDAWTDAPGTGLYRYKQIIKYNLINRDPIQQKLLIEKITIV